MAVVTSCENTLYLKRIWFTSPAKHERRLFIFLASNETFHPQSSEENSALLPICELKLAKFAARLLLEVPRFRLLRRAVQRGFLFRDNPLRCLAGFSWLSRQQSLELSGVNPINSELFGICRSPIIHFVFHPKLCKNVCFQFLLDMTVVQREIWGHQEWNMEDGRCANVDLICRKRELPQVWGWLWYPTSYQKSRYFVSLSLEAQIAMSVMFTLILWIFLWAAKQPMLRGTEVFYFKKIRSEG